MRNSISRLEYTHIIISQSRCTVYSHLASISPLFPSIFFPFQTPSLATAIAACRLEVMVYDYDQFSVDECVGYCWLTLGRVAISTDKDAPTVFWAEVLPFDENGGVRLSFNGNVRGLTIPEGIRRSSLLSYLSLQSTETNYECVQSKESSR